MTELTNSQRITYKATYAPTQRNPFPEEGVSPPLRAMEKINFVHSLNIRHAELPQLSPSIQQFGEDVSQQKQLGEVLNVIEKIVTSTSPAAFIRYAPELAKVSNDTLIKFGYLLAASRRTLEEEVRSALQQIRVQYVTSHQEPEVAAVTAPPPSSTRQGNPLQASKSTTSVSNTSLAKANILVHIQQNAAAPAQQVHPDITQHVSSPPLQDMIEWAATHRIPQIEDLYTRAQLFNPVQPAYSQLGVRAAILNLLINIQYLADMTVNATNSALQNFHVDPIGRLHLERLEMYPVGIERGELVHSVPLTPKETVNISHREWSTVTQEFESIVQDSFEGYSEQGVAEKNDFSQATESDSKHSTALDIGASLSASYSSITLSSSFGYSTKSDDHQAQKDSRNHSSSITRKASARTKKDHKFSFKVSSVAGAEDLAVRVITNPSDTNAMRVDYYQLIRKWKVDLFRYGLRLTYDIAIPSPGVALLRKLEELRNLDALIDAPPNFPLGVSEIKRENWINMAATYKTATIDPPPEDTVELNVHKELPFKDKDHADTTTYDALEFDVDPNYLVFSAIFSANYAHYDDKPLKFEVELDTPTLDVPNQYASHLTYLIGKSGKLSAVYLTRGISTGSLLATLTLKLKDSVFQAWRFKAWSAMRQAYEEAYYKDREILKERRAKLAEEIGKEDALTLRQMEREEVMKQVLLWLFGPNFEFIPTEIQQLFTLCDPNDPNCIEVLNVPTDSKSWQGVLVYGELIKFLHQAIEWENMLYFTYPYFWDAQKNWNFKLFLDHPDPVHRKFLRSGSARVVLTVRPGFEESFTRFMETGSLQDLEDFKSLGPHPYLTIAQEIANYAQTNYPGIPPANPTENARPLLYPRQRKAWDEMQQIIQMLNLYYNANRRYPSTVEGLVVLQPYITQISPPIPNVPNLDPWGNPYVYTSPGQYGDYDLVSYGADGKPGGTDENADITSWAEASLTATWYEYTPTSALDISINTVPPTTPGLPSA